MQDALRLAAIGAWAVPTYASVRRLRARAPKSGIHALLLAVALASLPWFSLCVPQAAGQEPDVRLQLAQAPQGPTIEVAQTLIVEPATDAPLLLHLKTTGILPAQSFVRIKGL